MAELALQAESLAAGARGVASPTLTELPDGRIACAWLADTDDTNAVWFSVRDRQGWRAPGRIATRESTAGTLFARTDRLDTPVLHAEGGWFHLWYVSTAVGNDVGRSLNHTVSTDGGASWSKTTRLPIAPWPMVGTRLSAPPIPLEDGGLALPVSYEGIARHAGWLRLTATGQIIDQPRMGDSNGHLPSVAVQNGQTALAVLAARPASVTAITADGGISWKAGDTLTVPTGDLPHALIRLRSGRLLLAVNGNNEGKTLQLWLGEADSGSWRLARIVEEASDGAAEFTEPALIQTREGRIHLAYAWRRQAVRHISFGESWLEGDKP
jgi:predicted neuraminidase